MSMVPSQQGAEDNVASLTLAGTEMTGIALTHDTSVLVDPATAVGVRVQSVLMAVSLDRAQVDLFGDPAVSWCWNAR